MTAVQAARLQRLGTRAAPLAGLAAVVVLAAVTAPGVFGTDNLRLILFQAGLIGITAIGQTLVLSNFALERTGPFPHALLVLLVALGVVGLLLRRTAWGRNVYAVGGDAAAARSNGVPVARTLVLAYVLCGVLAAAAGVMLASRATIGSPTAGQGLELSAIAVVVIGGSSLLGGRGTLLGTMGGVVLLALIDTSFTLLQIDATLNDLIRGIVILAAAAIFVTRSDR